MAAQHNQPGDAQRERDEHFMRLAIEQAQHGVLTPGGAEVGCVIVKDGELVCAGFNEAERHHDPTAHAEIVGGVLVEECARFYLGPRDPAPAESSPAHAPTVPPA